jgi:hypothetical protein
MSSADFRYRILNFLIVMGAMWIIAGLALAPRRPLWALALALGIAAALTLAVRRTRNVALAAKDGATTPQDQAEEPAEAAAAQERSEQMWWRRITMAEFLFIFLAIWAAEIRQRVDLMLVGAATVVALYFIGLGFVFRRRRVLATRFSTEGALMLALVAFAGTAASPLWRNFWIGVGMGAILWTSVLLALRLPSA